MRWRVTLAEPTLGQEEIAAAGEVIAGGWLSAGPSTRAFEKEFAAALGVPDAVAVSSGTAALHLALEAAGVGLGDEVIMPSLSFVAGAAMTVALGAVPVFADVLSPLDLTVDPADVANRVTRRTRAIVAMHYGGYGADLAALRRLATANDLALIEDAAHAPAVRYEDTRLGAVGDFGCFSFYANKNMTTGEGGMIIARSPEPLARCRSLRSHAMSATPRDRDEGAGYDIADLGFNYRPTELAAAIGRVQLRRLAEDRRVRHDVAMRYRAGLSGVLLPFTDRSKQDTAHHLFPIVLPHGVDRRRFREMLQAEGVQTSVHYPPTHHLTYYRNRWTADLRLPVTDDLAARLVSLPLHGRMTAGDADLVTASVRAALSPSGTAAEPVDR